MNSCVARELRKLGWWRLRLAAHGVRLCKLELANSRGTEGGLTRRLVTIATPAEQLIPPGVSVKVVRTGETKTFCSFGSGTKVCGLAPSMTLLFRC